MNINDMIIIAHGLDPWEIAPCCIDMIKSVESGIIKYEGGKYSVTTCPFCGAKLES